MTASVFSIEERMNEIKRKKTGLIDRIRQVESEVREVMRAEQVCKILSSCFRESRSIITEKLHKLYKSEDYIKLKCETDSFTYIGEIAIQQCQNEVNKLLISSDNYQQKLNIKDRLKYDLENISNEEDKYKRRTMNMFGGLLNDTGYASIQVVGHARVGVVHFIDPFAFPVPRRCDLVINNNLAVHNSELIRTYLDADHTGTVRSFILCVKKFAQSHQLNDASNSFLSSYAWVILSLHILLKEQLIPNLHTNHITATNISSPIICEGLNVSFNRISRYPIEYEERLQRSGVVLQLLAEFFRYYCVEFNVLESVVSIRGTGEVLKKVSVWRKPQLWRLSIEDPFELWDSCRPHDLGQTLSRAQQIEVFKSLQMGYQFLSHIEKEIKNNNEELSTDINILFDKEKVKNFTVNSSLPGNTEVITEETTRKRRKSKVPKPDNTVVKIETFSL
mmetsp:Transcript_23277/g.23487  ORF Transcript_23277/g.23487 Transcript_23277/m.23487 type:complete len:448 (+) Transcript_23277:456-1799(+)